MEGQHFIIGSINQPHPDLAAPNNQQDCSSSEISETKDLNLNNSSQFSGSSISVENPTISKQNVEAVMRSSLVDDDEEELKMPSHPISHMISEKPEEDADDSFNDDDGIIDRVQSKKLQKMSEHSSDMPVEQIECDCQPKILIVDDTSFNILAVKCMLEENFENIQIDTAENGLIGLNKFKEGFEKICGCKDRTYRLIFMDLQMPVMGGIESSKKILELMRNYIQKRYSCNSNKESKISRCLSSYLNSGIIDNPKEKVEELKQDIKEKMDKEIEMQMVKSKILSNSHNNIQNSDTLTHIVALTSYTNENVKSDCYAVGIKKVIYKPL